MKLKKRQVRLCAAFVKGFGSVNSHERCRKVFISISAKIPYSTQFLDPLLFVHLAFLLNIKSRGQWEGNMRKSNQFLLSE